MSNLINQPSLLRPTRKVAAVVISGMIIGGIQSLLEMSLPENAYMPLLEEFDVWIQAGVMAAAGYFFREREN